jgi:4-carboxymuconolactone decarboxylase
MARIPLPTPETMTPAQRAVYDRVVAGPRGALRGPLRAALYNPELADRWQALGELLRYRTSLTPRHSELAILVTGRHCRAPFEWHVHRGEAEKAGVEQHLIEAVLAGTHPDFTDPTDAAVHDFARELNTHAAVSAPVYARLLDSLGALAVVELTALVGYYTMVAMTLNAHQIPLPEGAVAAFEPALV